MEIHQSIATRIILVLLISNTFFSCNDYTQKYDEINHTHEVINTLVDKFTKPIPAPPNEEKNINPNSSQNKILKVGINPIMQPIGVDYSLKIKEILSDIGFKIEIDHSKEKNLKLSLESLKKEGKYLTIGYFKGNEKDIYDKIDFLYSFSTINFNEDYTKAVLILGVSRSKLSGFADLIVLKKVNNQWYIIKRQNLQIS